MPSMDRNARDATRLRRNAQRQRAGDGTGDLKTTNPVTASGGKLGLKVQGPGLATLPAGLSLQIAWNETPGGSIDGTNAAFTLAHTPTAGTIMFFVNGVLQQAAVDYTLAGSVITFAFGAVPQVGDVVLATYPY